MKYQNNAFSKNFLKNLILWYILLMIICIMFYFYFKMNINIISFDKEYVKSILNVFYIKSELKLLISPIFLFQTFLSIYTFISYFRYEEDNSPEFIYTRLDKIKCYNEKFVVIFISILIFRTIFFLTNQFLYMEYFKLTIIDYVISVGYHLLIIFIMYIYKIIIINLKNVYKID